VLACSSSLLLYGHLGRCQAETPLIQLSKFVRPALLSFTTIQAWSSEPRVSTNLAAKA
jgi:hypothetical protein